MPDHSAGTSGPDEATGGGLSERPSGPSRGPSHEEVVRGAVRGFVLLMTRTIGIQLMAFAASVGIARLISPTDFGLFAIAVSIQQVSVFVVYAGLPASLIRQETEPTDAEQRAAAGFGLLVAGALSGSTLLAAFVLLPRLGVDSTVAKTIAISCLALPLLAARMVPVALLTRELRFDRTVLIDITYRAALYVVALIAAFAGMGIYGLASAIPISALLSSALASRLRPWARGFRLDFEIVSEYARFGLQAGAFRLLYNLAEVAAVSSLALIASPAMAGFYALSRRAMGLPFAATAALQRVGFPALARIEEGGVRARQTAKAIAVSAVGMSLPLALLVGAAQPLVTLIFGSRWLPAADIMILSAAGLMVYASFGSVLSGRALADGEARPPLVAVTAQIIATLALFAVLVPAGGASGAGIALAAAYLGFSAVMFVRFDDPETRHAAGTVLRALVVGAIAAGVGQVVRIDGDLVEGGTALVASAGAWLLCARLLTGTELSSLTSLLRRHLRPVRGPEATGLELGPTEVEAADPIGR